MTMTATKDLLLHELGDILFAEKTIEKMIPTLQQEVTDQEFTERLDKHLQETREQIGNLERAFEALGEEPTAEKCPGILGLKEEHDSFVKDENPEASVLELFDAGSTARVEHYEIAAYTGLVQTAKALGEDEVAELLQQNLSQELAMLEDAERITERLLGAAQLSES